MSHRMRIVPALLVAAAAIAGEADEAPVQVRDFNIVPMGNLTAQDGTLRMHPKAMLSLGHDSNVYATERNVVDDQYIGGLAGIELRYRASESVSVDLDLQLRADKYFEEDDRDLIGGTADLGVAWTGEVAIAGLDVGYERFDDPLVQTGQKIQRENYDAMGYAGWQGAETRARFGAGYQAVKYLEDAGGFDADQRSYSGGQAEARVGLLGGEDTEIYAQVRYSSWAYEDDTLLFDGMHIAPVVGWRTNLGERTKLLIEGGADLRSYDDESGQGADDESVLAPLATVLLAWGWSERSELSGRLYATADNSLTSNAYTVMGGQIAVRHGVTDQAILFASGDYMQIADTASAEGQETEERTTWILAAGAEYTAVQGLAFRLTGRQTSSTADSGTGNDYDRTEVVLDTVFAF